MNFKPDEKNIRSLLKSGCQFVIPRFQREYSWERKNYEEFFFDMMNNLEVLNGKICDDQYFYVQCFLLVILLKNQINL